MSKTDQVLDKTEKDQQFYYDLTKFEVQAIAQRNQILLVFQSILFTALSLSAGKDIFYPAWVVIVLGLAISLLWLYLNALTYVVENESMQRLIDVDKRVESVFEVRKKYFLLRKGSVSLIMSFAFPTLMLLAWLTLLLFYIL
ncbi:hypothetical protein [Methylophaga muralis]|uniref:Uncharacterized protein n=1 Tax=Methylophaga muralis TaxID=291169 RepID=A0A1E3GST0_9GAMM|nr:hypothetical protein [Methylophaga muralis]ODN67110.1 hypothetical protein A9E74_01182 [Methylophaga muralis]